MATTFRGEKILKLKSSVHVFGPESGKHKLQLVTDCSDLKLSATSEFTNYHDALLFLKF